MCELAQAAMPHGRPPRTKARHRRVPCEQAAPGSSHRGQDRADARRAARARRARLKAYGRWKPFVDPGRAKAHVLMLRTQSIGWKRVAKLAGVSEDTVARLLYRKPPRPIRSETEAKILAVTPDLANLAAGARLNSIGSRRRLQALVAVGWPQRWLAARLGWQWPRFTAVMNRENSITAANARAVIVLYDKLRDQLPPQATAAERGAVAKALNVAHSHRWALPQAWDDDTIDNPQARPRILAVTPDLANLAAGARLNSIGSRRRLQALVAVGWPQCWLAARLGWEWARFRALMNRENSITAANARAVIVLYDELWNQPPPQATVAERAAVTRALNVAHKHRWALPQAWDDDAIDDPDAAAEDCRRRRERLRQAELVEEAAELIRSPLAADEGGHHGQGYKPEHAAERLGVTLAALDQALRRAAAAEAAAAAEDAA